MPVLVIRAGEHLARIARSHGFTDPAVVWNRPENQHLKDAGRTPDVLNPGDALFVPELTLRDMSRATDARYRAKVNITAVVLKVVLQQANAKALANASGTLRIGDMETAIATDGTGLFTAVVDATIEVGDLRLTGDAASQPLGSIALAIGYLDPVATIVGQESRLNNLGYAAGNAGNAKAPAFLSAVEEFQCDTKISVDGVCGPATQAKLKSVYGC